MLRICILYTVNYCQRALRRMDNQFSSYMETLFLSSLAINNVLASGAINFI